MSITPMPNRSGRLLRQRLASELPGAVLVFGVLLAGTFLLVGAVSVLRSDSIRVSGWEQAAQLARWYAGGVGVYATAVHLPLYLAHGFTRREFAAQLPVLLGAFAVAFGALMTLGYGIEALAYESFGWTQDLTNDHLYATATEYPLIFLESTLVGGSWVVAGSVLGGAFYRNALLGFALIPVALTLVGLVELTAGPGHIGPFAASGSLPLLGASLGGASAGTVTILGAAAFVAGSAVTWGVVRDLPMRSRST